MALHKNTPYFTNTYIAKAHTLKHANYNAMVHLLTGQTEMTKILHYTFITLKHVLLYKDIK